MKMYVKTATGVVLTRKKRTYKSHAKNKHTNLTQKQPQKTKENEEPANQKRKKKMESPKKERKRKKEKRKKEKKANLPAPLGREWPERRNFGPGRPPTSPPRRPS